MTDGDSTTVDGDVVLVVRRTIRAPVERVFEAWTRPEQLRQWWGPRPVTCSGAEIDLRVGGHYQIDNRFPDGNVLSIAGEFEVIDPPYQLTYTWRAGSAPVGSERVTVRFEPRDGATEVIVIHERIGSAAIRDTHAQGWLGCFEGLEHYLT